MNSKRKTKPAEVQGRESVLLRAIKNVELRLTPQNRLFCMVQKTVAFPRLVGGCIIKFDVAGFTVPKEVIDVIKTVLKKQQMIRRNFWKDHEEDQYVWQYN